MDYDTVFHIDADDDAHMNFTMNNIANYYAALPGTEMQVVLVANGPAARLLVKGRAGEGRLAELRGKGLAVRICSNAMRSFRVEKEDLQEGVEIVPAGILELVRLQKQGFAYIRP